MGYAVELFLEDAAAGAIRELFELTNSLMSRLEASPHVSLSVFDNVDTPKLVDVVRSFAGETHAFNIRLSSIGLFPGEENVVFLAPVVTTELLTLHKRFHARLETAGLRSEPHYLPGAWVPHCTITMEEPLPRTLDTIRAIHAKKVLGEYLVSHIHVVEFRPVVSLASFGLSDENAEQSRATDADKSHR